MELYLGAIGFILFICLYAAAVGHDPPPEGPDSSPYT